MILTKMQDLEKILILILFPINIIGQSYTSYYTGNSYDTISKPLGGICLMGGATEDDEAMKWFLSRASGGDVLVLRATGSNGYNNYMFRQLGVKLNSVETIVCNNKSASDETYIHQKIKQAEAIWFAGGDQWDYVSYWRNTAVDSLINEAINQRNIVIGGTSAGMAILGGFYFTARNGTVTSSQALSNPYNSKVTIDSAAFLRNKYLQNVITDTHYDNPDRRGRQISFLARIKTDWGIEGKGIACDEYAAICIDTAGIAYCYGDYPGNKDFVYFLKANCELVNNQPEKCIEGSPLEWNMDGKAVKVYKVNGTFSGESFFNLNDWKTGTGGSWENWSVNQGQLFVQQSIQPECSDPLHIKTSLKNTGISIYPNPVYAGKIHIDFPNEEVVQIVIMDLYGKKVMVIHEKSKDHIILDVSRLPFGIYFIRIETKNFNIEFKIVLN